MNPALPAHIDHSNMNLDWFKILIIDANYDNIDALEDLLYDSGYQQIVSYTNPIVALAEFHIHKPNLVLLDLRLPQMNGLDVLRKLKESHKLEHTDVMVLSEDTSQECKLVAFQYGAVDFISKPFEADEVQSRINNLIESRFQVKRLVRKNKTLDLIVQARSKSLQLQQNQLQRINLDLEKQVDQHNSELNNANFKLQQSNSALDKLISIVSHEFRTPLTSIKGYTEMLRDDADSISTLERSRFLTIIEKETSRLNGLVTDLLELQKLNASDRIWQSTPLNMGELVKHCIELSQAAYNEKNINLRCHFSHHSTCFSGDAEKIRQVILNTLSNALAYTDRGDVLVSVDTTEHWAEIILYSTNKDTIQRYEYVAEELEITLHTFRDPDQLQNYLHLFGRKTSILVLDIDANNKQHLNRIEQMCFPLSTLSIAVIAPDHPFIDDDYLGNNMNTQWLQIPAAIDSITMTQLIHDVTQTSINQKMVRVQITDTGVGIPSNQLNKIFSKFHQHNEVNSNNTAGIGLGLTISQEIVERHRGRIWVESECGSGSKFTVLLPLTR